MPRSLLPFPSHFRTWDGLRYHYLDEGQGEILLCVHGNPTWVYHWRRLIAQFRDRYRVIAIDHIGCGYSDKPRNYPYTLAQHVANLKRFIEELDLHNITLVAQDWGGAIGMGAAGEMPDRFARFVLCNTAAFRSDRMPLRIRLGRIPVVGGWAIQGLNLFLRAALRMAVADPRKLTPEIRAGYLDPYNNWNNRRAIYEFVQDIPLRPSHPSYATLAAIETRLSQFRQHPVQLIWGMRDWCFTPWFLECFREFFPQASVQQVDQAGHWVVEEAHEEVCATIDRFLVESGGFRVANSPSKKRSE